MITYNELFEIWKKEHESSDPTKLPSDFYIQLAEYVGRLKEEERMLDRKTLKAKLLMEEKDKAKRMILEIIKIRYKKFIRMLAKGKKPPPDFLTPQEEKILSGSLTLAETFQNFARNILQGNLPDLTAQISRKMVLLRFLKDVPSIIGADMKTYGPFKCEDVGNLPSENAKILVKQGLAVTIEI